MIDDSQAPPGIDASVATAARMYDYWLGGHDNFAADRIAALKVADAAPEIPVLARENRKFLRRAVRFLVGRGIEQFIDLGTGLPTRGNVHQVAQEANPRRESSTSTMTRWCWPTPARSRPVLGRPSSTRTCATRI